jgi:hypothetical protein
MKNIFKSDRRVTLYGSQRLTINVSIQKNEEAVGRLASPERRKTCGV